MLSKKLKGASDSKLTKALNKITEESSQIEKSGFIKDKNKPLFKTKSFRLREADLINFKNIISYTNDNDDRMNYSDSQVLRGLINYFADNIEKDYKKIIKYIQTSS